MKAKRNELDRDNFNNLFEAKVKTSFKQIDWSAKTKSGSCHRRYAPPHDAFASLGMLMHREIVK